MADNFIYLGNGIRIGKLATDPSNGKAGDVYYNTTFNKLRFFNPVASIWQNIGTGSGSGGAGINFIDNGDFEEGVVSPAVVYANTPGATPVTGTGGSPTVTLGINNTNPLSGFFDAIFTKPSSNVQGQGFSTDFSIDNVHKGQVLQIDFDYLAGVGFTTGSSSDIQVFIYDVTNAVLIPVDNPTILLSSGHFTARFKSANNSTSYRLIWHVATTSATGFTFEVDNIQVGNTTPQQIISNGDRQVEVGSPITGSFTLPVQAFTTVSGAPTLTFIAKATARYKLTCPGTALFVSAQDNIFARIKNSSGGAALVSQPSSEAADGSTNAFIYAPVNLTSLWDLVAGVSYTFDVEASLGHASGAGITFNDVNMIAEQLTPDQSPVGMSSKVLLSQILANGTRVTSTPNQFGQYRTQLRAASSTTYSDVNGAPTNPPNITDGMEIWAGNGFSVADSNNNPSQWIVFVGFNKNIVARFYAGAGKTDVVNPDVWLLAATSLTGTNVFYDPNTGLLTLNHPTDGTDVNDYIGRTVAFGNPTQGWFDVEISDNPVGVGGGGQPFWEGYHDTAATWSVSAGVFADFTNSGTPNLVQKFNNQIGPVTTAAGNLPGITFTPADPSAVYEIEAKFSGHNNTNSRDMSVRMWDGTTVIDDGPYYVNGNPANTAGGVIIVPFVVSGCYQPGTTAPVTVTLQGYSPVGTGFIGNTAGNMYIKWKIKRIA